MARNVRLNDVEAFRKFCEANFRSLQSSHINFILGAGASYPGVAIAGNYEDAILALVRVRQFEEADRKTVQFLKQFADPMTSLLSATPTVPIKETLSNYVSFIRTIDRILAARKNNLLPKQVSIFTTNYDFFIERASEDCPSIILNDGFNRIPSLSGLHKFASEKLFDATHHTGNLYEYRAELPSINLVKLHGSLTWEKLGDDIIYKVVDISRLRALNESVPSEVAKFLDQVAAVLPTQRKFQQTILERTYYDLLRIFANVMERENSLLISLGFSFNDEHILEVVKRALRNPTLNLIICCYSELDVAAQKVRFASYNNVTLLVPDALGEFGFDRFNAFLSDIVFPQGLS